MLIALWSNEKYETGVTTLACVLSTLISAKYSYRTLLTHPMTSDMSMENYVLKAIERNHPFSIGESDTDALFRLIKNGKISSDEIKDYCYSLLGQSNLDLLQTDKIYEETASHHMTYSYLLHLAKNFYDVIVVDLQVNMESPIFEMVIKECDAIISVANQNSLCIKETIDKYNTTIKPLNSKAYHKVIVNRYDLDSSISFKRLVGTEVKTCVTVPYKKEIMDGCNRSELVDVLLKHFYYGKKSPLYDFYKPFTKMTDKILIMQEDVS